MAASATETELKLLATAEIRDEDVLATLVALPDVEIDEPAPIHQTDVYVDDSANRLARHGFGLRLRTTDGDREVCWKRTRRIRNGIHVRDELTQGWNHAHAPGRVTELEPALRARVEPFVYGGPLEPLLELATFRRQAIVRDGRTRAELCIDRVEARHNGHGSEFVEIEIELLNGDPESIAAWGSALRDALPLRSAKRNKLARGLELCEAAPDMTPARIRPGTPARIACEITLERALDRMQLAEFSIRTSDDAEPASIADLRDASRAARAVLRTFQEHLDEDVRSHACRIARTARAFDGVHAFDVTLGTMDPDSLTPSLRDGAITAIERLAAERRRLVRSARAELAAPDRIEAMQRFQTVVDTPLRELVSTRAQTRTIGAAMLRDVAARALEVARTRNAQSAHVALRRLIETADVFAQPFGKQLTTAFEPIRALARTLEDRERARSSEQTLMRFARSAAESLPGTALIAIGALSEQRRNAIARAEHEFAQGIAAFDHEEFDRQVRRLAGRR